MKPGFALSLSVEGISLLHRAAGGWRTVGEVSLESASLGADLVELRTKAQRLSTTELSCKILIPNDQIRYLTIETGAATDGVRTEMVLAALEGATPYSVADLAFDISVEGEMTHIAAVARETLAEAEAFAVEYAFHPVCFVAVPADNLFLGEPHFGPTSHAASYLNGGRAEPDGVAVVIVGMADIPEPPPPEPEIPAISFSSRRRKATKSDVGAKDVGAKPVSAADPVVAQQPPPKPTLDPVSAALRPPVAAQMPAPPLKRPIRDPKSVSASATSASLASASPASGGAPPVTAPPTGDMPPPHAAFAPLAPQEPYSNSPTNKTGVRNLPNAKVAAVSIPSPSRTSANSLAAPGTLIAPMDEAQRLTLFGARTPEPEIGGKPRHLGLVLTAVLLLFLAGIAAWAALFTDNRISGLLFPEAADSELVTKPAPATNSPFTTNDTQVAVVTPPSVPAPMAQSDSPPLEEPAIPASLPGANPSPTEIETAVAGALRTPLQPTAPNDPAAIQDQTLYVATGIWQTAPQQLDTPAVIGLDNVYIASIDRTDLSQNLVTLQSLNSLLTDIPLRALRSPLPPGLEFDLDNRGLVIATVAGAISPSGVVVYLGPPPKRPPTTPARDDPEAEQNEIQTYLAGLRPLARPAGLVADPAVQINPDDSRREKLRRTRPLMRPDYPVSVAVDPPTETAGDTPDVPAVGDVSTGTALAIATSIKPLLRPENLVRTARASAGSTSNLGSAAAGGERLQLALIAPRTVKPSVPSSASVARQATLDNAINLRKINLIGVYGTPANRRALVRLPSGRYKKIKVGDRIDGGRVLAIGDSELRYQKGGRSKVLKIPSG